MGDRRSLQLTARPVEAPMKAFEIQPDGEGGFHLAQVERRAVPANGIRPVVDKVFPFDAARDAFEIAGRGTSSARW